MTTPLPLGLAPYISPLVLQSAPTGVDWSTIGEMSADPSPAQNMSEMWAMAGRATARVDGYLAQTLRATIDVELLHGPDYRVVVGPASGGSCLTPYWGRTQAQNARLIMSRWPVLQVTGVKTCPNGVWPRQWTALPDGFAEPEVPPIGLLNTISAGGSAEGGQAVIVGGGYINWSLGRNGWAIEVTYINGYPHCSLTSAVAAGATSLPVNDCAGWGITNYYGTVTGATGVIQDGGQQESVHVTATSVTSGPGNLTLSQAISYPHQAGTVVTTMPASVQQACIYFATAEALTRGATSTTIHAVGGASQSSDKGAEDLIAEGELLLHAFRRTILSLFVWFQGFLIAGAVPVAAGEQADGTAGPVALHAALPVVVAGDAAGILVRAADLDHRELLVRLVPVATGEDVVLVQDAQFRLAPGDRVLRVVSGDERGLVRVVAAFGVDVDAVAGHLIAGRIVRAVTLAGASRLPFPAAGRTRQRQPRLDLLPRPCGHVRFAHAQTLPPPLLVAA